MTLGEKDAELLRDNIDQKCQVCITLTEKEMDLWKDNFDQKCQVCIALRGE